MELPPLRNNTQPLPAPPLNNDSEGVAITYPVSPTGTPVMPPKYVPYAAATVAAAAVVQQVAEPRSTLAVIAAVVLAVGVALGIASPGLRRASKG